MKESILNLENGRLTLRTYRVAEAQVTTYDDIKNAVETESEETLCATLSDSELLDLLDSDLVVHQNKL